MKSAQAYRHTICFLALLALQGFACGPANPAAAPCTGDQDCTLQSGGRCLPSPLGSDACAYPNGGCAGGYQWGELTGSIAGTCVSDTPDAAVDAPDAAVDAPIDAGPSSPIVTNYQPADLVLGQPSFTAVPSDRGFAANSLSGDAVATNPNSVWAVDATRGRVLQFSPLPTIGDPNAVSLVGRPSLTDNAAVGTPNISNLGTSIFGISSDAGMLIVADAARNRVLVWNPSPTAPGAPATLVIGQPDFVSSAPGTGASQLRTPGCVWTDGTMLIVCDTFNHRVLIWQTFPSVNGEPADVVLGQSSLDAAIDPISPSSSNLSRPFGALVAGTRLYVSDTAFNRVLVWDGIPVSNNQGASFVLGQDTFTDARDVAASPVHLRQPRGLAVYRDALLVSDVGHQRVVVFQPLPTTTGTAGALVLGQPDLSTQANPGTLPTQRNFRNLGDISVTGNRLFVSDPGAKRVLRFTLQ